MRQETTAAWVSENRAATIALGVFAGTAIGVGIALSRRNRRPARFDMRRVTRQFANRSSDVADVARDIVGHLREVCEVGKKLADDAGHLWSNGRKMVSY